LSPNGARRPADRRGMPPRESSGHALRSDDEQQSDYQNTARQAGAVRVVRGTVADWCGVTPCEVDWWEDGPRVSVCGLGDA
jgi:hypothetical protein